MSLNQLIADKRKPWLNVRVNNLRVDGSMDITAAKSQGPPSSYIYDTGVAGESLTKKPIELQDLAGITSGATTDTYLRNDESGELEWTAMTNIYNSDGTLDSDRTIDCDGNTLEISNGTVILGEPPVMDDTNYQVLTRNPGTGAIETNDNPNTRYTVGYSYESGSGPTLLNIVFQKSGGQVSVRLPTIAFNSNNTTELDIGTTGGLPLQLTPLESYVTYLPVILEISPMGVPSSEVGVLMFEGVGGNMILKRMSGASFGGALVSMRAGFVLSYIANNST